MIMYDYTFTAAPSGNKVGSQSSLQINYTSEETADWLFACVWHLDFICLQIVYSVNCSVSYFSAVYSNINKNYTPLLNPPLIGRWCRSLLWCGSATASDYIQSEHWNLIWVLCVNLMVRGPFSLLILEVKHILWGHCLQIYNLNFPWQQPLLCASKQGGSKRCVLVVSLEISKAKEQEEENIGCVNMPSAPRAPSTITYGMSCISIYTGW